MISKTVLIAARDFGPRLGASRVMAALAEGLCGADPTLAVDPCPLAPSGDPGRAAEGRGAPEAADGRRTAGVTLPDAPPDWRGPLDALDFDSRMRHARAVVIAEPSLRAGALRETPAFEIATRARQGGIPCYAVTAVDELDLFEARILDLQVILEAKGPATLRRTGIALAPIIGCVSP